MKWLLTAITLIVLLLTIKLFYNTTVAEFFEWQAIQTWQPASAKIKFVSVKNPPDHANAYITEVSYTYNWDDEDLKGSRVAIDSSTDSTFYNLQKRLAQELQNAKRSHRKVTIFVNPVNPEQSIYNRDLRWFQSFKSALATFLISIFCGIVIIQLLTTNKRKTAEDKQLDKMSLGKADSYYLASSNLNKWLGLISVGFAIYAFFPSVEAIYSVISDLRAGDFSNLGLLIVIFFYLLLLAPAVYFFYNYKYFGNMHVVIDSLPDRKGGIINGTLEFPKIPYTTDNDTNVTLVNIVFRKQQQSDERYSSTHILPIFPGTMHLSPHQLVLKLIFLSIFPVLLNHHLRIKIYGDYLSEPSIQDIWIGHIPYLKYKVYMVIWLYGYMVIFSINHRG